MALSIKRNWVRCQVGLERATGQFDYIVASFQFYEKTGKKVKEILLHRTKKQPVDEIIKTLEESGFKQSKYETMREVVLITYSRKTNFKIETDCVRYIVTLQPSAVSDYAYDFFNVEGYDDGGEVIYSVEQLKVKKSPVTRTLNKLKKVGFKITKIDTEMYKKTYHYERETTTSTEIK